MAIHDLDARPHIDIDVTQSPDVLFGVIQKAPCGLFAYTMDADNRITFASQGLLDMLGYTEDEFMAACDGRFPMMVYGPDRARVVQAIDEAVEDGKGRPLRYRIACKNGSVIWVQDQGKLLDTPTGDQEVLASVVDVTAEHEARLALQELVNGAPAGLITFRKQGEQITVESFNNVTRRFLDTGEAELVGKPVEEWYRSFVDPDDHAVAAMTLQQLFGPKMEAECMYRVRSGAGEWRWLNYRGRTFPQADGSLLAYGVHIDRTQRQLVTERLREQQQVYQAAIDTAQVLVWEYLPDARCVEIAESAYANEACARLGIPLKLENMPDGLQPFLDKESGQALVGMLEGTERGEVQQEVLLHSCPRPDLPTQTFRVTSVVIYDSVGAPVKVCGTAQDITRQWAAADDYRQELAHFNMEAGPDLVAKGHANLSSNVLVAHSDPVAGEPAMRVGAAYDQLYDAFTAFASTKQERANLRALLDRDTLLRRHAEGHTSLSCEYRREGADLASAWVMLTVRLLQHPDTGDVESFMYTHDRTEQHLERTMMQRLAEFGYDYIGIIDPATRLFSFYRSISPEEAPRDNVLNYDEVLQRVGAAGVPDDELENSLQHAQLDEVVAQLAQHGHYDFTYNLARPDGGLSRKLNQFVWLDDQRTNIFFVQSDITQQFEEEQERIRRLDEEQRAHRHTSNLLQNILDTTPTSIFWKDDQLRYQGANAAFLRFLGLESFEPLAGRTNAQLGYPPSYEGQEADEQRILEEACSTSRVSGVYAAADGSVRNIAISKSPMIQDGHVTGLVGSFEDVTDEVESAHEIRRLNANLQTALTEAEQARQAEQSFLSNMSHDMRTPLNGIVGFTRMALATDDAAQRQEYLEKIDYSGQLLLAMVNDVLDMSKIASGQMELSPQDFDCGKLLESTLDSVRVMAQQKGIELACDTAQAEGRFLRGDTLRLQQILLNILGNAVKYTRPGGHVSCAFSMLEPPQDGCNTLLVVSDDGIGMSDEFQQRMFEPFAEEHRGFEAASTQGTGLGLSIVKSIVEIMHGRIEVESTINVGSTFRVYLPVEPAQAPLGQGETAQHTPASLEGKRVMVFEDNDLNAQISQAILGGQGMEVVRVCDGREGFEAFVASDVGHFDALLMDMRMPKMGGLEAARAIRALDRPDAARIPIVAMTADAFADDVQACLKAGMNAHISKPIDPDVLIGELARLCG